MHCTIYFGEKGCGKTSKLYLLSKNKKTAAYFCGKQNDGNLTYSCLMDHKDLQSIRVTEIYEKLSDILNKSKLLIIDSAQYIDGKEFELLINAALTSSIRELIIIFDFPREQFSYCRNSCQLAHSPLASSSKIIDFICPDSELKRWIGKNYPNIDPSEYDRILQVTNRNFLNIADLMWHKKNIDDISSHIGQEVYISYLKSVITTKFEDLPPDLLCTLQKSSVIGMDFQKSILESSDGFSIFEVSTYLSELEKMRIFIVSSMEDADDYSFVTNEVHTAVLKGIRPETKKAWLEVLVAYFQRQLKHYNSDPQKIRIFEKLKIIYTLLGDRKSAFRASVCLLQKYARRNDFEHCITLAEELYHSIESTDDNGLKQFFFVYLVQNYKQAGEYKNVLACIKDAEDHCFYRGSLLYIDYYKAFAWYNIGNVDEAKAMIEALIDTLQATERDYFAQQPLYSLVFSLAATIYHHLHLQDDGLQYYRLALNHAKNKLIDKGIYYDILKKCDMYYDYTQFKREMAQCIDYYQRINNQSMLAEVYFNLGTECMMQDGDNTDQTAMRYLMEAERIFSKFPNENFAYVKNNLALYFFLVQDNIEFAFKKLEEALILGLSHFTYMTIYLNLCSFLIYMGEHHSDTFKRYYEAFFEHVDALNQRTYPTKYESVYRDLLEISFEEKEGHQENVLTKCNVLCLNNTDSFFQNIVLQIIARNSDKQPDLRIWENKFYYQRIDEAKIFLAEFRFWE